MHRTARRTRIALATVSVTLAACSTHLWVYSLPDNDTPLPAGTFPYALSKARLTTTFNVVLTDCGHAGDPHPSLRLAVTAATTETIEPDPSERFYVDYTQLKSIRKTTNFIVNSADNQTLQGVNTESSDQTLQVAGAFLQTTAQIAGTAVGAAVPIPKLSGTFSETFNVTGLMANIINGAKPTKSPAGGGTQTLQVPPVIAGACSPGAVKALQAVRNATQTLTDKSGRANGGTPRAASDTQADPGVTAAANEVVEKAKPLTVSFTLQPAPPLESFVPAGDGSDDDVQSTNLSLLTLLATNLNRRWVDQSKLQDIDVYYNDSEVAVKGSDPIVTQYRIAHWSRIARAGDDREDANSVGIGKPDNYGRNRFDGLIVRQPAVGKIKICVKQCAGAPRDGDGLLLTADNTVEQIVEPETPITLPQFGKRLRLPLDNSIGEDTTLKLTVGTDGSLNMLSFVNNSTAAAGLQSIGAAGTAAGSAVTARDTAIAAHNTAVTAGATLATSNATLAASRVQFADVVLKAQADCLSQLTTIVKSGGIPSVDCK